MPQINQTDHVREFLISQLTFGKYMPGHAFKLREMTEEESFHGMSQTPIREALLQLVSQNILMGQRGFTVRVPMPSVEHLTEVREIRTKLEVMAALQKLPHWTAEEIEQLEAIDQKMLDAKSLGDVQGILSSNARFHMALCGMEKKSYLQTMIQTLWAITGPSIGFLYVNGMKAASSGRHPHIDIIRAVKSGDAQMLEKALVHDLVSSGEKILKVLQEKFDTESSAVRPFGKMQLSKNRARPDASSDRPSAT